MKTLILTILFLGLLDSPAWPHDPKPSGQRTYSIYNEKWERKGYIKEDGKGDKEIFDEKWQRKGYEKDGVIYDKDWNRKGFIKEGR